MSPTDHAPLDALLTGLPGNLDIADEMTPADKPRRDLTKMMRKIPVTVTLEVGAARISLDDLMNIRTESVVELDTLAGEPLVIKVNGTPIGRAEVVVMGDNYGLKVVELSEFDLDAVQA
ncbi:MAG TPA: flagellar motor switch protein FliN [Burkholderiaceae bacterium]|nr:flagellar motor switch protein FliN [Burkholderiaceae bacterium]